MSNPDTRKIRFTHTDGDGFILAYTCDEANTVNLTCTDAITALNELAQMMAYEYDTPISFIRASILDSLATSEASPSLPPQSSLAVSISVPTTAEEAARTNTEQFYDLARAYMRGVATADECITRARELGFTDQQWFSHMTTCNIQGRPPQA